MASFFTLALNTFEETLRRKVIYILLFLGILVGVQALYNWVYMAMAENAGETEMLANMRSQFVVSLFGLIEFFAVLLATFLGAVGLSSEIKHRTIVPVLSRPVGRVSFLVAKWVGTIGFLALFIGLATLPGLAIALHWQLYPSPLFALGIAQIFLQAALVTAVSLALSSVFHPILSGGAALLLLSLASLTEDLVHHPNLLLTFVGLGGQYLAPAEMPESLVESGLVKGLLHPDYALYLSVLGENAGYAVAAILAGALLFRWREIRIA